MRKVCVKETYMYNEHTRESKSNTTVGLLFISLLVMKRDYKISHRGKFASETSLNFLLSY